MKTPQEFPARSDGVYGPSIHVNEAVPLHCYGLALYCDPPVQAAFVWADG